MGIFGSRPKPAPIPQPEKKSKSEVEDEFNTRSIRPSAGALGIFTRRPTGFFSKKKMG